MTPEQAERIRRAHERVVNAVARLHYQTTDIIREYWDAETEFCAALRAAAEEM